MRRMCRRTGLPLLEDLFSHILQKRLPCFKLECAPNVPECARMCHECAPECANSNLLSSKPYFFIATPAATAVPYGLQKRSTCFQFECAPTAPRMCHGVCQLGLTPNKTYFRCEPKSQPSCCTRWRCSATVTRESCRAYVHTGCVVPTCDFCARAVTEGAHERNRSPWRRISSSRRSGKHWQRAPTA